MKEVLELGLAGVPILSMLVCGDRAEGNIVIPRDDITAEEAKLYFDQLCLRWYQLATYMPTFRTEYGHGDYNELPSANINYKWIYRSLSRRIMVSIKYKCGKGITLFESSMLFAVKIQLRLIIYF